MKIKKLFVAATAIGIFAITSCKVNEHVQPVETMTSTTSIPNLTQYLSRMLLVQESEIKYDANAKEFTVRDSVKLKESQVQATYRIANEYKKRYNITK